jgi:hypothetical protein
MTVLQSDTHTVLLTDTQVERLKSLDAARRQQRSQAEGTCRVPREKAAAIREAITASLFADMRGLQDPDLLVDQQNRTVPIIFAQAQFLPCQLPFEQLRPIGLADLLRERHHRGQYLSIRRISPVISMAVRSWAVVQDVLDEGHAERLELLVHTEYCGVDILDSGSQYIVKEPFFTINEQGQPGIRVFHPSDLIVMMEDNDGRTLFDAGSCVQTAVDKKDAANAALRAGDLILAHRLYSEGLAISQCQPALSKSPRVTKDIFRNRSQVNLLLHRYEEAQEDAVAALSGGSDGACRLLDSKALFRAGKAAYARGRYEEAKSYFQGAVEFTPGDQDNLIYLRKIEAREAEQLGEFNFSKLRRTASKSRTSVDAADFVSNTIIRRSPGKGHGLFAACQLDCGAIVMVEKAFAVHWKGGSGHDQALSFNPRDLQIRVFAIGLTKAVMEKLRNSPSQLSSVLNLKGSEDLDVRTAFQTDDGPVLDAFRIHNIVARNAFAFSHSSSFAPPADETVGTGLWLRAARINHSCTPNVEAEYFGDLMVLRALRPLKPGEEILHAYDQSSDYDQRQSILRTHWAFDCQCELCLTELADGPVVRANRAMLAAQAGKIVVQGSPTLDNASRLTAVRARKLAKAIKGTYSAPAYQHLPQLALRDLQKWLEPTHQAPP